jgi:two-component system, OmpR family, response regulator
MRVLLVEDDDDLVEVLVPALCEEGFEVERSADGAEGLDCALTRELDVVVLDLMLPGLDGRAFLRHLRLEHDVPVLVLTARGGLAERVAALDDGADDYLTKPFELPELVARLRALVRRSARRASDEIRVGDLVLDLRRRTVHAGGERIDLAPQELRLLEALALADGEPVSELRLWQRLAATDEDVPTGVVRVHVHRLRARLGAGRIQTRRGFGYCLVDPSL